MSEEPPIYKQITHELLFDPLPTDPPAATAGEQDHTDPWHFAGEPAGPPEQPQ